MRTNLFWTTQFVTGEDSGRYARENRLLCSVQRMDISSLGRPLDSLSFVAGARYFFFELLDVSGIALIEFDKSLLCDDLLGGKAES